MNGPAVCGDLSGELDERRHAAASGPTEPSVQGLFPCVAFHYEDVAQSLFEQVGAIKPGIGLLDPSEALFLVVGEVRARANLGGWTRQGSPGMASSVSSQASDQCLCGQDGEVGVPLNAGMLPGGSKTVTYLGERRTSRRTPTNGDDRLGETQTSSRGSWSKFSGSDTQPL
jgi:hypothetical protein